VSSADELRSTLDREVPRLLTISDDMASVPVAPGKWTPKEIVGHLVDSASNNHGRFVRANLSDDFVFLPYDQEEWVTSQKYNDAGWVALIELWRQYNLHLAHVMDGISQDRLSLPRMPHNLHRVGWRLVPEDVPATLGYFIDDYVGHMKHHLAQIP
jgi:hypothetical protein